MKLGNFILLILGIGLYIFGWWLTIYLIKRNILFFNGGVFAMFWILLNITGVIAILLIIGPDIIKWLNKYKLW